MNTPKLLFCNLSITLVAAAAIAAQDDSPTPYDQKMDLVYGEVHGTGLLMDIFTPKGKPNGLAPARGARLTSTDQRPPAGRSSLILAARCLIHLFRPIPDITCSQVEYGTKFLAHGLLARRNKIPHRGPHRE